MRLAQQNRGAVDLCLYTDSVPELTLDQALELAAAVGASAVEVAAGGQSSAPHMRVFELLDDAVARRAFADKISTRGLRLAAINCSAWPMHPRYGHEQLEVMRAAVRLAADLEVEKIVAMSGLPGDSNSGRIINWITYPWPSDAYAVLDEQWEQALDVWAEFAAFAAEQGITRIALELHPLQLVYNVPTLLRLREAIGPMIGANVDPSHMFWQQMDPVSVVSALRNAVYHVHLKDLEARTDQLALAGVLDSRPFADPDHRAWIFRTVGQGHGSEFWTAFLTALHDIGYHDVLSIENEDPTQSAEEGVREAARFITGVIGRVLR
jgi:sugar phosphate isomerase/epimerase